MKPCDGLPESWHDQGRRAASHGRDRGPRKVSQATTAPQGQKGGAPLRSAHGKPEAAPPVSPHSARATAEQQRSDAQARPSPAPPLAGRARRLRAPDVLHHDNAATTTTTANHPILSGLAAPDIGISGTPRIQPSGGWDATPRAGHGGGGARSRARNREEDHLSTGKVRASRPSENQHPGTESVVLVPTPPLPRDAEVPVVASGVKQDQKPAFVQRKGGMHSSPGLVVTRTPTGRFAAERTSDTSPADEPRGKFHANKRSVAPPPRAIPPRGRTQGQI